ncbi:MAG: endolytic transglycosylase MltG [Acidobacteriia bacterium]|nr:endolytic transglycosylase MltG [Terriglobia bacterium]
MHFVSRFWYRTTVLILFLALSCLAVIIAGAYLLSSPYKGFSEKEKLVEIPHGTRVRGIVELLEKEGIIRHPRSFLVALLLERRKRVIRAGEYNFDRPLTEFEVIQKLLRGEVHYHEVTVPEGSNIFDIAGILQNAGLAEKDEFLAATTRVDLIKEIDPIAVSLEGYLFPDTYKFERHTPVLEIIGKMLDRFRKFVTPEYLEAARKQNMTLHEAVILASLIEKETGKETERPVISAVFLNRLRIHQRLECDPTVIYAALLKDAYRGKLYRSDMQIDSPYNTYLQSGLPLGPIANPGKASLEAAVHPDPVDYLYFVSDNNGGHVFAKTLAQHQNAVHEYRRALAQDASIAPHPSAPPAVTAKPRRPGTRK